MTKRAMILNELAHALRGMPRNAKMLVELPAGSQRPLPLVRPGLSTRDHPDYEPDGYPIILCVEDRMATLPEE